MNMEAEEQRKAREALEDREADKRAEYLMELHHESVEKESENSY